MMSALILCPHPYFVHARLHFASTPSVRSVFFLPAKTRALSRPMPRRASASAVLLASVGACLRHLPPSLHSSSVTPVPILFTICTQKSRQPQTMYLICTHVVCTRAIYQNIQKMQRPMMMQMCSLPICCRELSYYSSSLYSFSISLFSSFSSPGFPDK